MANIPEQLQPGHITELGSFTFTQAEIIRFASEYDPHPFHMDPEAAKNAFFGCLVASGWHQTAIWMKLQRAHAAKIEAEFLARGEEPLEFGPSPGIEKLGWLKPVLADETIHFSNRVLAIREMRSRPGWMILSQECKATNEKGEDVMVFESSVLVKPNA